MDRLLKGLRGLAEALFALCLLVAGVILGIGAFGGLIGGASAVIGAASTALDAPADCRTVGRPAAKLMEVVETGSLLARRRALAELPCAPPKSAAEFDRLAAAARSAGRRRLRAGALAALSKSGVPALKERALALAADPD